jgi:hypothetical protein
MTTNNTQDAGQRVQESAEFAQERAVGTHNPRLEDLLLGLDGLIVAVQVSGADEQVKARQSALWEAAWRLIGDLKSKDATSSRCGRRASSWPSKPFRRRQARWSACLRVCRMR